MPETSLTLDVRKWAWEKAIKIKGYGIPPRNINVKQRCEPSFLSKWHKEGEAEDERVDLEVDGQPVDEAGEQEHLLLVEVDGEQDQGDDDRLCTASCWDVHDQGVVKPGARC